VLLIGTANHLQCYDVHENKDVYFKEVPDGVNVVVLGQLGARSASTAVVGGNCSIQVEG
jgi:Bardet-Biedl syndrome 2 protein